MKRKFEIGEVVQIKPDLLAGKRYNDETGAHGALFTAEMSDYKGQEARIVSTTAFGYSLNIGKSYFSYTSEMLQEPVDYLALQPYTMNREVEELVHHMEKIGHKQVIDKALDDRLHEVNPEEFRSLVDGSLI